VRGSVPGSIAATGNAQARLGGTGPLRRLGPDPNRFCPGRRRGPGFQKVLRAREADHLPNVGSTVMGDCLGTSRSCRKAGAPARGRFSLERVMLAVGLWEPFPLRTVPPLHPFGGLTLFPFPLIRLRCSVPG